MRHPQTCPTPFFIIPLHTCHRQGRHITTYNQEYKRHGREQRTETGMGLRGEDRVQHFPHGEGRNGKDHILAKPARAVAQAHGGARPHGHSGHKRRRSDDTLILPVAPVAVRAGRVVRRPRAETIQVRQGQAKHHQDA